MTTVTLARAVKGFSLGTSSEFSLRPSKVIRRSTDKRERVCAKVDSMNRPGISAIRYSGMPGRRRRRSRRHRHRHCRRNQKRDGRPNGEVNAKTILAPCQAISFAREAVVAISASNSERSTLAIDKAIHGHSRRFAPLGLSALGQKQTLSVVCAMSALPPKSGHEPPRP